MELPAKCIEYKRELLSLLQDILKRLPEDEDHSEIRRRIKLFTEGMCPKLPIIVSDEDEIVHPKPQIKLE